MGDRKGMCENERQQYKRCGCECGCGVDGNMDGLMKGGSCQFI